MRSIIALVMALVVLVFVCGCSSGTVSNDDMVNSQAKINKANGLPPDYNPQGGGATK